MDFETVRNYLHKPNVPDESKRQVHAVGVAMSTVRASTEWKVYADHLEALKQAAEVKADRYQQDLLNGPVMEQPAYYENKRQYAIAKASAAAYTMAIELVDMLVERGEAAAQDIVSQQIAG